MMLLMLVDSESRKIKYIHVHPAKENLVGKMNGRILNSKKDQIPEMDEFFSLIGGETGLKIHPKLGNEMAEWNWNGTLPTEVVVFWYD